MALRFGTRRFSGARRPTRQRVWARRQNQFSLPTAGIDVNQDILVDYKNDAGVTAVQGVTMVRTILDISVEMPGTALSQDHVLIALRAGPITTLDPETNPHSDWLFWKYCPAGENSPVLDRSYCHFDVKSMRKIDELEQSVHIHGVSSINNTVVRYGAQVLLLLP